MGPLEVLYPYVSQLGAGGTSLGGGEGGGGVGGSWFGGRGAGRGYET